MEHLGSGGSGQFLETLAEEKAAASSMFGQKQAESTGGRDLEFPDVNRAKATLALCFILLYVVSMLAATILMQQEYRKRFLADYYSTEQLFLERFDGDINACVNEIGTILSVKNEGQLYSAAAYDAQGNQISVAKPSVRVPIRSGQMLYFSFEEYFGKVEVMQLLSYARAYTKEFYVEATIDKESERLLSLEIADNWDKEPWLVWNNKTVSAEEQPWMFSRKMTMQELLAVPYYEDEEEYEEWLNKSYLHNFSVTIDTENPKEEWTVPFLEDAKQEQITKVVYRNEEGEKTTYYFAIRATGNTLKEAVRVMIPVYLVGLAVMFIGIISVEQNLKKWKK